MQAPGASENAFLSRLTKLILDNIEDEMFGVSELAEAIGMSRSNLLRKIKKNAHVSASQFIRQIRLNKSKELIIRDSLTVSEAAYRVGFGSTSYFIKCFREEFGFPPGELGKRTEQQDLTAQTHQLAAIMFTDIEGYTALMQKDEEKAVSFRNRHREIFESLTKKYHGNILQYFGDGTLSTFQSAIEAVRCGMELQLAFRDAPAIPVRIGVHTGDILFTPDGIVGDGVNIASRIESLAAAGSVFISEKVYDEIKNQSGIETESMGFFELKNVEKPMEVYAVANAGLLVPDKNHLAGKAKIVQNVNRSEGNNIKMRFRNMWILLPVTILLIGFLAYNSGIITFTDSPQQIDLINKDKKSIAVLPFINDSNDSANVYIINGLMESTLNNLQKIKDLRVVSRTSVEKYRDNPKTIREIADELNVKYIVEGSGQKIGNQILLNIQLIETDTDEHVWGEQYNRQTQDIFELQREIAKKIAKAVEVMISPQAEKQIDKTLTDNLTAYDYFLKGIDLLTTRSTENMEEAVEYFTMATEEDPEFARAYAGTAIAYYYLDEHQAEKKYTKLINQNADNALLYDPTLPQSFIAKALFFMNTGNYPQAVNYFEKALEYNPNYDLAFAFLVDIYVNYLPNTQKYLEYALKGIDIDIGSYDSTTASYVYLHLSNAFIQSGFTNEAEKYINKSLAYDPDNLYSAYLKAFIMFAKNKNLAQTREMLLEALGKDSTRYDIIQEVAKISYFMGDYETAYTYYMKFTEIRQALNLDIYRSEDLKIAFVLEKTGFPQEAEKYLSDYEEYALYDQSIYKHADLAMLYAYRGENKKALEQLRLFSQEKNYHYWILLFYNLDPVMANIKNQPEFKLIFREIEEKFWQNHNAIKTALESEGLI